MVEIYLTVPTEAPLLALSIPSSDIQRLSIKPLKWIRFTAFAMCGVQGDLLATLDGPVVDYDTVPHSFAQAYYYAPQGELLCFGTFHSLLVTKMLCC